MRISCVLTAEEIGNTPADIIVFPEGVCKTEIQAASAAYPDSIVVGTEADGEYCRGILMHRHKNRIEYLKIGEDGRTALGSARKLEDPLAQNPIYETSDLCIGVLICMDVQNPDFSSKILKKIRSSDCKIKVLCIPADMSSDWFNDNNVHGQNWRGMHVALCNHTMYYSYPSRCQSFVTDTYGRKIAVQENHYPLHTPLQACRSA